MLFDRLIIDMSEAWEWNQVYAACEFSRRHLILNMLIQDSEPSKEFRGLESPASLLGYPRLRSGSPKILPEQFSRRLSAVVSRPAERPRLTCIEFLAHTPSADWILLSVFREPCILLA
jgi:hypothetical protein